MFFTYIYYTAYKCVLPKVLAKPHTGKIKFMVFHKHTPATSHQPPGNSAQNKITAVIPRKILQLDLARANID